MGDSPLFPAPEAHGPIRWHVGFTPIDPSSHWIRRLLVRVLAFPQHVRAFRDARPCVRCGHPGPLLVVEHTLSRLMVTETAGATAASHTAEIAADGGHVIAVDVPAEDGSLQLRLGNCITTTRALLALRARPQTARGLALQLRARLLTRGPRDGI